MFREYKFGYWWIGIAIAMLVAITVGSLSSTATISTGNIPNADKLIHFSSYFILSIYLCSLIKPSKLFYVGTFCFLWGLGIEIIQPQFDGRQFEWLDLLANSIAVTLGGFFEQKFNIILFIEKRLGVK